MLFYSYSIHFFPKHNFSPKHNFLPKKIKTNPQIQMFFPNPKQIKIPQIDFFPKIISFENPKVWCACVFKRWGKNCGIPTNRRMDKTILGVGFKAPVCYQTFNCLNTCKFSPECQMSISPPRSVQLPPVSLSS